MAEQSSVLAGVDGAREVEAEIAFVRAVHERSFRFVRGACDDAADELRPGCPRDDEFAGIVAIGVDRTDVRQADQPAEITCRGDGFRPGEGQCGLVGDFGQCRAVVIDGQRAGYYRGGLRYGHAARQREVLYFGRCIERVEQAEFLRILIRQLDGDRIVQTVESPFERIGGRAYEAGLGKGAQIDVADKDDPAAVGVGVERRPFGHRVAEGYELFGGRDALPAQADAERCRELFRRNGCELYRARTGAVRTVGRSRDFEHRIFDVECDVPAFERRDVARGYVGDGTGDVALLAEGEFVIGLGKGDDGQLGREFDGDRRTLAGRPADAQRRNLDAAFHGRVGLLLRGRGDGQQTRIDIGRVSPSLGDAYVERRGVLAGEFEFHALPVGEYMGLRGCLFVECECDVVFQGGYGERIGLRAACLRLYFDDHVAAGLGSQVGGWGGGDRTAPRAGDHGAFPACGRGGHRVGDECTL